MIPLWYLKPVKLSTMVIANKAGFLRKECCLLELISGHCQRFKFNLSLRKKLGFILAVVL